MFSWIYMVYPWIYLDIPSFLKPDFSAGPCCWIHAMRTRLLVFQSVLLHAPPWQWCQGKRCTTKVLLLGLLAFQALVFRLWSGRLGAGRILITRSVFFFYVAVAVAVAVASAVAASRTAAAAFASGGGGCGAGGCGAGIFTGYVALETFLFLVGWSRQCRAIRVGE